MQHTVWTSDAPTPQEVFGQLVRLSRKHGHEHYLSDLWYDAVNLQLDWQRLTNAPSSMLNVTYWTVRESGTHLGRDKSFHNVVREQDATATTYSITFRRSDFGTRNTLSAEIRST